MVINTLRVHAEISIQKCKIFQHTCEGKDDDISRHCYQNCTKIEDLKKISNINHRFLALVFFCYRVKATEANSGSDKEMKC
jgi:hypothetical protein